MVRWIKKRKKEGGGWMDGKVDEKEKERRIERKE